LPRLFEVYADDDALAFSIETLPFVDSEKLNDAAARTALSTDEIEEASREALKSSRPSHHRCSPSQMSTFNPTHQSLGLTPEAVSMTWVASLTLSFLSHFTGTVLPSINALSSSGAAQLMEDLEYMDQIIKAVNVDWEPLQYWKASVSMQEDDANIKLRDQEVTPEYRDILIHVCKVRGWTLSRG